MFVFVFSVPRNLFMMRTAAEKRRNITKLDYLIYNAKSKCRWTINEHHRNTTDVRHALAIKQADKGEVYRAFVDKAIWCTRDAVIKELIQRWRRDYVMSQMPMAAARHTHQQRSVK